MANKEKKCIGFILLKRYPGCRRSVGSFEPFTTGEFLQYPEIWQPVYNNQSVETDRIIIEVKVTNCK